MGKQFWKMFMLGIKWSPIKVLQNWCKYNKSFHVFKIANVIFLETPQCVGFSYDTSGKCDADDDTVIIIWIIWSSTLVKNQKAPSKTEYTPVE